MKAILIACAALLGGCATNDYAQPHELTNVEVCEAFFYAEGDYAAAAGAEATSRGLRCPDYRDAIAQARRDRQAAGAQVWLENRPRTTSCTSYRVGNGVQTNCR
jgi:hypothetical protein